MFLLDLQIVNLCFRCIIVAHLEYLRFASFFYIKNTLTGFMYDASGWQEGSWWSVETHPSERTTRVLCLYGGLWPECTRWNPSCILRQLIHLSFGLYFCMIVLGYVSIREKIAMYISFIVSVVYFCQE